MIAVSHPYGWRPEPEEIAAQHWGLDRVKTALQTRAGSNGDSVDLRPFSLARHDQLASNSCVANSVIKALEILRVKKYGVAAHVDLSRLAVYYLGRELMPDREDGTRETEHDDGMYVSSGADCVRRFGVCTEALWPFDLSNVVDTTSRKVGPTWRVMRQAYVHKIDAWYRVQTGGAVRVEEVILALRAGFPVVFGTVIGDNWFQYQAGEVLGIPATEKGRHATCLVGWLPDVQGGVFVGESSWGEEWGDNGFYLMAPEVIADWGSDDFIVMQVGVEGW